MSDNQIEWCGTLLGILGSWLVAMDGPISKYGFLGFLMSNLFMLVFAAKKKTWGLFTMQLNFTGSSLLGIYNKF